MSVLQQLISRIPGLDDYNDQVRANQAGTAQQFQQAGQLQAILQNAQAAPFKNELMQAQVAEHRAKAAKLKQEQDFNAQFMQMGGPDKLGPDQLDAFASKAAMMNHPGALGLARLADQKRAQMANSQSVGSMQSQLVADQPAATEADAVARINAGGGAPMSIGIGDNPNIIPRKAGGVADYLASSPYVGSAAKQLQERIDRGLIADPKAVETRLSNLDRMHATMTEAQRARDQGQAGKIEIRNMFPPQERASATGGSAETTPGDFAKQGNEYLESLPVTDRELVRKIAAYEIDPKTLSIRGGHRERVLSMVSQYEPAYDDTQYANKRRAIAQFGSGPQGNTVRSLNVAIEHIDTVQRAAEALKNGSFTPANKAYNEVAKLFGRTPPNTFEAMRDIVANEVMKGTIGNITALQDRQEAANKVKASASPEQLNEMFNGWIELMGGQVKGLSQQYEGSTGLKDFSKRYLTPRALEAISIAESKAGGGVPSFATEAEAEKAGLKPGTRVKIGGKTGVWK